MLIVNLQALITVNSLYLKRTEIMAKCGEQILRFQFTSNLLGGLLFSKTQLRDTFGRTELTNLGLRNYGGSLII